MKKKQRKISKPHLTDDFALELSEYIQLESGDYQTHFRKNLLGIFPDVQSIDC